MSPTCAASSTADWFRWETFAAVVVELSVDMAIAGHHRAAPRRGARPDLAVVDLSAGRLSVIRSLVDVEYGRPVWSDPKTSRGRRSVALDAATLAALKTLRAEQLQERLPVGADNAEHDLVFARAEGGPRHPDRTAAAFRETVARLGLPAIRLHDLRHTWATLALEAGVHPKVVQERLGHANVSITLDLYSHVAPAWRPTPPARSPRSSSVPEARSTAVL